MCGAIYNVTDFPLLEPILGMAGYSESEIEKVLGKKECRPTDSVLAMVPTREGPRLMPATWWLKLDQRTLKPDTRWATFNCRSDHILTSKLHTIPPKSFRSIVVANGFFEWQPVYSGGRLFTDLTEAEQAKPPKPIRKQRYLVHTPGQLMLLGALCKHWLDEAGQPKVSTGIITLPPHPRFLDVHHKSFPLVLKPEELEAWLNPKVEHSAFEALFGVTDVRVEVEAQAVNDGDFEPLDTEPFVLRPVG